MLRTLTKALAADDAEVSEQCVNALWACSHESNTHEVAEVLIAEPGAIPRLLQHFVQPVSVWVVVGEGCWIGCWVWEAVEELEVALMSSWLALLVPTPPAGPSLSHVTGGSLCLQTSGRSSKPLGSRWYQRA